MHDQLFAQPPRNIQERTFEFACRITKLHQYLHKRGGTQREIGRQVLRSGTSIGANLEEADAGQSKPDFISKCGIALKEARETHFGYVCYEIRISFLTNLSHHYLTKRVNLSLS